MATQTRNPTSDISATGTWTGTAGSRYTLVDDYPSTDTADQLTHGNTAGNIRFGFTAFSVPAGATDIVVRIYHYDREATSGNNNFGSQLIIEGAQYITPSGLHLPTTTTTLRTATYTTNPRLGTAWTVNQVNGSGANSIQAFGLVSTDANPQISVTSIQIEVEYTEPTGDTSAMFLLF